MQLERQRIIELLRESHGKFVEYVAGLTVDEFLFAPQDKWTAGQQLEHIYLAVRPVVLAFRLPKLLVRSMFGKANRPSKSYDDLVKKYQYVLQNGGKSSRPFIPRKVAYNQKEKIVNALTEKINSLCTAVATTTDETLDRLILPHPLLGKLTMREMLYFTIHHVGHHHDAVRRNLGSRPPRS
jgi:hypothetical protein